MTAALTDSTVEPVTPEYAESLGFVPSYTPGFMFTGCNGKTMYLEFSDGILAKAKVWDLNGRTMHRLPLPTRYNLARIVEEFTQRKSMRTQPKTKCTVCNGSGVTVDPKQNYDCDVCGNTPDAEGCIEHGKGCYVANEDGGGCTFVGDDCSACYGTGTVFPIPSPVSLSSENAI